MEAATAHVVRRVAQALLDNAKSHTRLADYHRRRARRAQRQLEQLRRECAELGIELPIDTAT